MAKQPSFFYCLSFILLVLLLSKITIGQHTTSPRFSPNPQPTSSGVYCIQMVCPSPSLASTPSCPAKCPSGCKYVPDQCCPQITVAVCQDGNATSLPSSSSLGVSAPSTTSSSSNPPTTTVKANTGLTLQPSIYNSIVVVVVIGSLFIN